MRHVSSLEQPQSTARDSYLPLQVWCGCGRTLLAKEQQRMRGEYEQRLRDLESERLTAEHDKAKVRRPFCQLPCSCYVFKINSGANALHIVTKLRCAAIAARC